MEFNNGIYIALIHRCSKRLICRTAFISKNQGYKHFFMKGEEIFFHFH